MGESRRIATLTAFAAIGELHAQDQVLDHLDTILDEIDGRAVARERNRRLRIAGMIDQAGLKLADACALVLDDSISDPELRDATPLGSTPSALGSSRIVIPCNYGQPAGGSAIRVRSVIRRGGIPPARSPRPWRGADRASVSRARTARGAALLPPGRSWNCQS